MDEKYANDGQAALKGQQYLSVTCNGIPAVLNRSRLGSGGKGRCIEYNDELLTPNEFQARCGKASSKDWKRSIRYHGRPISRLIDQKVLTCHAISCICAACSDDANVQTPVRYFKKWNRKRRAQAFPGVAEISQGVPIQQCKRAGRISRANHNSDESIDIEGGFRPVAGSVCTEPGCLAVSTVDVVDSQKGKHEFQTCKEKGQQEGASTEAIIPPLSNLHNEIVNDIVNEQKCWWHLETVAENILRDAITLKTLVSRTKETSMASKANILVQLRNAIAPSTTSVSIPQSSDEAGRQDMLLKIMAMARSLSSHRRDADPLRVDDHQPLYYVDQARVTAPSSHSLSIGSIGKTGSRHPLISSATATAASVYCQHNGNGAAADDGNVARMVSVEKKSAITREMDNVKNEMTVNTNVSSPQSHGDFKSSCQEASETRSREAGQSSFDHKREAM